MTPLEFATRLNVGYNEGRAAGRAFALRYDPDGYLPWQVFVQPDAHSHVRSGPLELWPSYAAETIEAAIEKAAGAEGWLP